MLHKACQPVELCVWPAHEILSQSQRPCLLLWTVEYLALYVCPGDVLPWDWTIFTVSLDWKN